MNRRELLLKLFPAVLATAAMPTIFLPPKCGWPTGKNRFYLSEDGIITLEHPPEAGDILSIQYDGDAYIAAYRNGELLIRTPTGKQLMFHIDGDYIEHAAL